MPGANSKWISVFAAMGLLAGAATPAAGACKLQRYAAPDAEIDDGGAVIVPAKVNDQDVWMILGMASGLSAAWPEAARQLGLTFAPGAIRGKPVLGELGSKMLTAMDMELDLGHGKVNLFKRSSCNGDQVYWADAAAKMKIYFDEGGLMVFPLEIDGKRVEAALNTQGPDSLINEAVTRRYFGFGRDSPDVRTNQPGLAKWPTIAP